MDDRVANYHLAPLDQVFHLCKEIYTHLDQLNRPVIIIGGQSISYWLEYYDYVSALSDADRALATSVDVDFCGSKADFLVLTERWNVKFRVPNIDQSTPEVGISVLLHRDTGKIKETDGLMYVDIGAWINKQQEEPNQVDFLELPMGFEGHDFKHGRLLQHTELFEFPSEFELAPVDNLRVLNPIACIKSRMLNYQYLKKAKDPERELDRINLLILPTALFLQSSLLEFGYRHTRKYIDLLMVLAKSRIGMELKYQGIDLSEVLVFFVDVQSKNLPRKFIDNEFVYWLDGLERKFERKLKEFQRIEEREWNKANAGG
ncbi:hypothetical protein K6U66_02655 [Vibrio alginolyticus]|uniref:Nucleotidyltransferase n=1 Tax=Vibrio chemaguriensis TaxID=2527672 RepID=A0ABX1HXZ2_9VIBR|nr:MULTISPECIES: hypothetical protein [Vibrio]MCG6316695.1 hypothetical protein [Vibrio alginolyticus]NKJ68258.1 hypothetical protein [Vibrio chemaguriensis]